MAHARFTATQPGQGGLSGNYPEWLRFIWQCNKVAEELFETELFGEPADSGPWWAGGHVEEYEHARVLHRPNSQGVSIVSKTDLGDQVMREAGNQMNVAISADAL